MNSIQILDKSVELINDLVIERSIDRIENEATPIISNIRFYKKKRRFCVDIESALHEFDIEQHEILNSTINIGYKLRIPQIFISNRTANKIMGQIASIHSENYNESKPFYNRLLIPYNGKTNFTFSIQHTSVEYRFNGTKYTNDAVTVKLKRKTFLLYKVSDKIVSPSSTFIIVESKTKLSAKKFQQYCYSILLSFGYISGNLIQDEGFFLQYDKNEMIEPIHFSFTRLRDTIKCTYTPICKNTYGWIKDKKLAKKYDSLVRELKSSEFSFLCKNVFEIEEFKSILLLLMETSNQSLVSGPGSLSIALETLSNVIKQENEKAFAPIKEKILARKVRNELIETLNSYSEQIEEDSLAILNKRISGFNQLTNKEKLLTPFKILNINLNESDKKAIDQRNAFLHGKDPMIKHSNRKRLDKSERLRYYLFLKIYTLIASLILKRIGFDNMIVNYPKIFERETKVRLNEGHYRQI